MVCRVNGESCAAHIAFSIIVYFHCVYSFIRSFVRPSIDFPYELLFFRFFVISLILVLSDSNFSIKLILVHFYMLHIKWKKEKEQEKERIKMEKNENKGEINAHTHKLTSMRTKFLWNLLYFIIQTKVAKFFLFGHNLSHKIIK